MNRLRRKTLLLFMSLLPLLCLEFFNASSARAGDVYLELVNQAHGLCLDANASGDGSNGDTVQLWSCWGGSNQEWAFVNCTNTNNDGGGPCEVRNEAHGLCLDANAPGDGSYGDRVQLWSCNGGANQLWDSKGPNTGYVNSCLNQAHLLALDANASGDGSNGDTVQLWGYNGGSNQYWLWGNTYDC